MEELDDATLREIEEEMAGDGVWIDPAFARTHDLGPAEEAALEQVVLDSPEADLRVVLTTVSYGDRFNSTDQLAAWMQDDLGGDATWVMWQDDGVALAVFGNQPDAAWVDQVAAHEHPGDVVAQVQRSSELLESGEAQTLWYAVPDDEKYPDSSGQSDGGFSVGWLVGGVVAVLVLGWVLVSYRHARREKRGQVVPRGGFELPTAVLRGVREAEDRQRRQLAEREVLALGEALAAEPHRDGPVGTWQASLDHYAAARSVLDNGTTPADVVGALVLARRGESARQAADAGGAGPWEPAVGCFFNPLHAGSSAEVAWRSRGARATVPACRDCAADVRRGNEPGDVLDFISGDSTEHYFRLPLGVWSETGFGTVDPDLLGALVRRSGARRRRWLRRP